MAEAGEDDEADENLTRGALLPRYLKVMAYFGLNNYNKTQYQEAVKKLERRRRERAILNAKDELAKQ